MTPAEALRESLDPIDHTWAAVPVDEDEWQAKGGAALDLDKTKCPVCDALTKNGICLNTCHLSAYGRARFRQMMGALAKERGI